jgi:RNA polymerase sigma-70 factor (ECF subfamily)
VERPSQELVENASRGDPVAIEELLERHLPMLRAYFRLKAGPKILSQESVSDLVQSVCLDVLGDLSNFEYRGEAQFRGWLVQHAWHKLMDRWKYWNRAKRKGNRIVQRGQSEIDDGQAFDWLDATLLTPSREAVGREELAGFEKAFSQLPENTREAILLRRIAQLPYSEIATLLRKSEGAVRNLVSRGLAKVSLEMDSPDHGSMDRKAF